MKKSTHHLYIVLLSAICLLGWGCKAKKDKPKVKFMKNLTAHYNIYFNAKESLGESETAIKNGREDDFSQLLEIFPLASVEAAANESENLEDVIRRANIIAIEKYESNWLDDSYLLLADAEHLRGDYYNAIEYYSYVGQTFTKEKENRLKAYLGQVKADFALGLNKEADSVLNMAIGLKYKYQKDEVAASQAKLAIINNDIKSAISHLRDAVGYSKDAYQKTRWRYILAQLQEIDGDTESASSNYSKIAKSNASFEMSFNANLSKIRITENAEGKTFDKIATLKKLLKEDKNRQLKDQIYYQIAKAYQEKGDYLQASEYYSTAAHTIPGTAKQKGLSYLKLAELNFETLKDYSKSQLYYDSTLQFLPKTYPNYTGIAKKASNLQYLANRLTIIETEKNSLYLATLSDDEISKRADSIFVENEKSRVTPPQLNATTQLVSISDFSSANKKAGTFYFYNDAALGQGLSAFKQRWGNRKLTDNWRISSSNLAATTSSGLNPAGTDADIAPIEVVNRDSIKARLVKTIPYTAEAKQRSSEKISTALYEIALFYKDVLNDEAESVQAFEAIIQNFPDDKNLANIYYQLYRQSAESNPKQSEIYKQELLRRFPNSVYARSILQPNFGKEREFRANALKDEYATVYQLYNNKKYAEVLSRLNQMKPRYSTFTELEPTFAYLEALTIGHTQKTPVFLASLNQIVKSYPNNTEITPVVKHQIEFIGNNRAVFDQRPTALLAHDNRSYNFNQPQLVFKPTVEETKVIPEVEKPTVKTPEVKKLEPAPVVKQPVAETPVLTPAPVVKQPVAETPVVKQSEVEVAVSQPIVEVPKMEEPSVLPPTTTIAETATPNQTIKNPTAEPLAPEIVPIAKPVPVITEVALEPVPEKPKGLVFSSNERQRHLIVIDISDPKQNIAQPFSKLSRYFYSKFDPSEVKLVIRIVGGTEKFVIISGNFYTKEEVQVIADELSKSLPTIMEGQTTQYQQFVISEDNLKLLTNKAAIDQYLKSTTTSK